MLLPRRAFVYTSCRVEDASSIHMQLNETHNGGEFPYFYLVIFRLYTKSLMRKKTFSDALPKLVVVTFSFCGIANLS